MEEFILVKGKSIKFFKGDLYLGCYWNFNNETKVKFSADTMNLILTFDGCYLSYMCDRYEVEE